MNVNQLDKSAIPFLKKDDIGQYAVVVSKEKDTLVLDLDRSMMTRLKVENTDQYKVGDKLTFNEHGVLLMSIRSPTKKPSVRQSASSGCAHQRKEF